MALASRLPRIWEEYAVPAAYTQQWMSSDFLALRAVSPAPTNRTDPMPNRKPPKISPAARLKSGVAVLLAAVLALAAVPAQAEDYYPDVTATISYSSDSVRVGKQVTMTVSIDKSAGSRLPSTTLSLVISFPDYLTPKSSATLSGCGYNLTRSGGTIVIEIYAFQADGATSCVFTVGFVANSLGTSAAPTTSGNVQVATKPMAGITSLATPIPASLSELLMESAAVDASDYTSSSYAAFKSVYDATTTAIANDPGMDEASIAALESPLQTALDAMVSVTALIGPEQNLTAAKSIDPYTFTGASYAELNRVLGAIATARVSGTDSEIGALVTEAQTVIDAQVSRADLIIAMERLNEYVEGDYTAWSWARIQEMKDLADDGILGDTYPYTDADIAWNLDWINNTDQVITNITPLIAAIDTADSVSTEGMTPASVARFDAALAAMVQWRADATDPTNWIWDFQPTIDEFDAAVNNLVRSFLTVKLGDKHITSGSTIRAGSQLHLEGGGLQPGSQFRVELHSTPTVLGSVLADADGKASLWVSVPSNFAAGSHTLHVFSTELGAFAPTDKAFPVTITSSVAAPAGRLPDTGGTADGFALGAGFLLLLIGAGLRLSVRRSRNT